MPPFLGGGDMIDHVSFAESTFKDPPHRFEAGTPPIVEAIGLAAAIDYVDGLGRDAIQAHEPPCWSTPPSPRRRRRRPHLRHRPRQGRHRLVPDGRPAPLRRRRRARPPRHRRPRRPALRRALMHRLGVDGTVRASFGLYSTHAEVDALAAGLAKAKAMLG
jgi:cysteine desulfurase / selenocysteine lyase